MGKTDYKTLQLALAARVPPLPGAAPELEAIVRKALAKGVASRYQTPLQVGYLGSIPLLYQYGYQTILAAATTSYAVDPVYRSRSLGLVGSFFRQEGCDLYLNTTATVAAGKIMRAFKADQLPQKDYEVVLFWVLDTSTFLHSVMNKLEVPASLGNVLAALASPVLNGDIVIRKRRPVKATTSRCCRELRVDEIGDDFESLWLRRLEEKPRLFAHRTPEVLRWHFRTFHAQHQPQVLACYERGFLLGYAVLLTETVPHLGLQKSLVADLFVARDEPDVITELLAGAYELAKKNRSDILEMMGFPEGIRSICRSSKPYSRSYPACPFFYRTDHPELRSVLANQNAWYACPYDGDATLHP